MRTDPLDGLQDWWQAVRSIAAMVHRDGIAWSEDADIKEMLAEQGFSSAGIVRALDWIEHASLSGNLMDALSMLTPESDCVRVQHPTERVGIHPRIWRAIERSRMRGLISMDMAERLIDGFRTIDTRDWEREDIEAAMREILKISEDEPGLAGGDLLMKDKGRDHYH